MVTLSARNDGLGYILAIEGLEEVIESLNAVPERIDAWLSQSVNRTLTRFRTQASRAMREQIAFPARYLISGQGGRLTIPRRATPSAPEGVIRGRFEPTSLTRFVKGPVTPGRKSPTMQIKQGRTTRIGRSFIIGLANGNRGLAIRLKEGESIQNKRVKARRFSSKDKNLFLLFGPSVDQVFRTVREDISPEAATFLENEFLRLAGANI